MEKKSDKIFHSGRGGSRPGTGGGKPRLPEGERRVSLTVRLPSDMVERLRDTGRAGRIIEQALNDTGFMD